MIEELHSKYCVNAGKVQAIELDPEDKITLGGADFTVFKKDNDGNAHILLDDILCKMAFGENDNNYKNSKIKPHLRTCELTQNIIDEIGVDGLVPTELDLWSHDGLRDYGVDSGDLSGLLTYDMYRENRENISLLDCWWWLCTPDSTASGWSSNLVRCVDSDGYVFYNDYRDDYGGVRPFYILKNKSDIFVSKKNQKI